MLVLKCLLMGHKFWIRDRKDFFDDKGIKHQKNIFYQLMYCDRCGTHNPNHIKNLEMMK